MPQKPVIFVSAVGRELRSARLKGEHTLESLGIAVEVREIFNVPQGDLREALCRKINRSAGLIHCVGQHCGFELPLHETPLDPCRSTRFEARYARHPNKKDARWMQQRNDCKLKENGVGQ